MDDDVIHAACIVLFDRLKGRRTQHESRIMYCNDSAILTRRCNELYNFLPTERSVEQLILPIIRQEGAVVKPTTSWKNKQFLPLNRQF